MSQTYRIKLRSCVSRTVNAEDSITYPIELTEIIPLEDMTALLGQKLKENGFSEKENGEYEMELENGEILTVNLEDMTLKASLSGEKEITTEVEVSGQGESEKRAGANARRRLRNVEQVTAEKLDNAGEKALEKELIEKLQDGEEERMAKINEVLQEVYAESLKRKAATLGDVMDIREGINGDGQYELDIRVEL